MHGIQPYPREPGRSQYHLVIFANVGDIIGTNIAMVTFDRGQLAIMADTVEPGLITRVQQLLDEDPLATALPPSQWATQTRAPPRHGAWFISPHEMVELLLGVDLNARQVYELVVPVLQQAGLEETCASLIDFLTVALVPPR
jgi:hypothetical protein